MDIHLTTDEMKGFFMSQLLRVLIVEDLPTDAELEIREVQKTVSECKFEIIETHRAFIESLKSFAPDIILCDFKLPQFDGLTALKLAQTRSPDTPFIIVTGSMNEDTAVDCMKAGAWDYVIKEHLQRLGPAIQNALAQKKLRLEQKTAIEKSRQWERLFEKAQFGLAHLQILSNTFIEVNKTFAQERKYAQEELIGQSVLKIIPLEEHDNFKLRLARLDETGHAVFESMHKRKDESRFPVIMEITTIYDDQGLPASRVVYARDITERKEVENTLRNREILFRNLFERHAAVELILDPDTGAIIDANQSAVEFYGWSRKQLQNMQVTEINTKPPKEIKKAMEKVRAQKQNYFEFKHRKADGSLSDVEIFSSKIQVEGKEILHSIIHDITKRKQAENSLRLSEANLKKLQGLLNENQRLAGLGGWEYNPGGEKVTWTDEMYRIMGLTKDYIPGDLQQDTRFFIPHDRKRVIDAFAGACEKGIPYDLELQMVNAKGKKMWVRSIGQVEYKGKNIHRIFGNVMDITEHKKSEAERERLAAGIKQVGESIMITDPKGVIQYVNPTFEIVSGYSSREVIGQSPRLLKSDVQNSDFYSNLWNTITEGRTWKGRIVNRRKSGELFTEDVTISPVRDSSGIIINFVAVKRDITEHLRLEAKYLQAQKMESVGRLAGGVAHDYNNILSIIMGYTELALDEVDDSTPIHDHLKEILDATLRSDEITRKLLTFARKQVITPKTLDLNATLEEMLKMLRRLIGEDISLAWLPAANLWAVRIDPTQVDQILANLCVNARDAIDGVGRLTIETKNTILDRAFCMRHTGCNEGDYVLLSVKDSGQGMDEETLGNIFEPFFTTKEKGKGTGLGLATVYGIVKQNNGYIDVISAPNQGATFNIYLPRYDEQEVNTDAKVKRKIVKGYGETVLVVEDDTAILNLVQKILKNLNYSIITANSPKAALDFVKTHQGNLELLITDIVMPEMNGQDLAERLKADRPQLKILFISGYAQDVITHQEFLKEGTNFIKKPFSKAKLSTIVRSVLDTPDTP